MTWLKTGFFVKAIPYAKIEMLDQLWNRLNMNPVPLEY